MEDDIKILTYFDSPERSSIEDILIDKIKFEDHKLSGEILEAFPELVILLNENRQIIKCNNTALKALDASTEQEVIGKRFGEAIKCQHQNEMPGGCGTAKSCRECGAAKAIKITTETHTSCDDECRITALDNGNEKNYNFHVYSKPIIIDGKYFTIFSIKDISHEKRKEALERIFFHDILNTSSTIQSIANLLPELDNEDEKKELTKTLIISSNQLIHELISQRELSDAENGNLKLSLSITSANEIVNTICDFYRNHAVAKNKILECSPLQNDFHFTTDSSILIRSMGNLLKNAFEGSKDGETIKLWIEQNNSQIIFSINNKAFIPENVQLQIFQRSFSTKGGKGRGIGTYSVKLLVEQYLKGKVEFTSTLGNGTTFSISLSKFVHL